VVDGHDEPWAPYEAGEFTSGAEFGELFLTYVAAMREVDPQIRFVVGGAPWPDFVAGLPEGSDLAVVGNKLDKWNRDLVRVVGKEIEAISMQYTFPGALGRLIRDTPGDLLQAATGGDALGPMLDRTLAEVGATTGGEGLSLQLLEWDWQVHSDELLGTNHRLGDALLLAGCWNRMIERPDGVRAGDDELPGQHALLDPDARRRRLHDRVVPGQPPLPGDDADELPGRRGALADAARAQDRRRRERDARDGGGGDARGAGARRGGDLG
jgi:hypothetical protein